MLNCDTLTIIVCAILLVLAIGTPLLNPFFRMRNYCMDNAADSEEPAGSLPPLSVIIPIHQSTERLGQYLDQILAQKYPDFRIIVIAEKGDGQTEDTLKRYASCPNIYTTFIPTSSRYMSRNKLAVTLGVKAAQTEWIVLTNPSYSCTSDEWLLSMAKHMTYSKHLVIGYTGYAQEARSYQRFERLQDVCYALYEAINRTAYRACGANIAFRKDDFLSNDGYTGNLQLTSGEYDFIINKFARKHLTTVAIAPSAHLREARPTPKRWRNEHLAYLENCKYFKHNRIHQLLFNIDTFSLHLNYWTIIAAFVFSVMTKRWVITAVSIFCFLLTTILRLHIDRRIIMFFHEGISTWRIIPHEFHIMWTKFFFNIRFHFTDKQNFTTHKM